MESSLSTPEKNMALFLDTRQKHEAEQAARRLLDSGRDGEVVHVGQPDSAATMLVTRDAAKVVVVGKVVVENTTFFIGPSR